MSKTLEDRVARTSVENRSRAAEALPRPSVASLEGGAERSTCEGVSSGSKRDDLKSGYILKIFYIPRDERSSRRKRRRRNDCVRKFDVDRATQHTGPVCNRPITQYWYKFISKKTCDTLAFVSAVFRVTKHFGLRDCRKKKRAAEFSPN